MRTILVVSVVVAASSLRERLRRLGRESRGGSRQELRVVAAENFWGSIASQLGGSKVSVQSIIVNPNTDPHSYEPTASDARSLAGAELAIVNGIGYDTWASHLIAANPVSGRMTLDVGTLLGLKAGDNPHQWYSPSSVQKVIAAIDAGYDKLDPADKAYFAARRAPTARPSRSRPTDRLRAEIRRRFTGVPVGYSESIFQPLGQSLGLELLTPYSFAKAVAEGTEISAQDKETVDAQAQQRLIKVWIYNSQNATPDIQRINAICRAHGIPIATVTETLSPASDSFEQWQVAELRALIAALHRATGRGERRWPPSCEPARAAVELCDVTAARNGRPGLERGEHPHGAWASSSPCSARTERASRRCSTYCSACSRRVQGRSLSWAAPPAPTGPRSATCRSGTPSTRRPASAVSTSFASAWTATASACP